MRLGWAYGARVVDALNRIRGPFNVSAAALAAGEAAIRDRAFMIAVRDHTRLWRDRLTAALEGLGLSVAPSVCNFVLVAFPDTPGRDAAAADAFLKSRGVIVRRVEAVRTAAKPSRHHRHGSGNNRPDRRRGRVSEPNP